MHPRRSWFRPARAVPPEAAAALVLFGMAIGFYLMAPTRSPAVTASIAPACADAAQPCRGGVR